jgi:hypothetical protein
LYHKVDDVVRVEAVGKDSKDISDDFQGCANYHGDEVPGSIAMDLIAMYEGGDAEKDHAQNAQRQRRQVAFCHGSSVRVQHTMRRGLELPINNDRCILWTVGI